MRKPRIFTATLLLSAALTSLAHATGGENGNGGDAVACRAPDGSIRSAEQADYYEARVVRGISIDLGAAGLSWPERVEVALKRLEKWDPTRAERYRQWTKTFLAEARFIRAHELPDVPDTGGIVVPNGCRIEQVAIQKEPRFPEDSRYLINEDLWKSYDTVSQTGLVLHELIYREAISFLAKDSIGTRYFNSILASPSFEEMTLGGYLHRLVSTGLYSFRFHGRLNRAPFSFEVPLGKEVTDDMDRIVGWESITEFTPEAVYLAASRLGSNANLGTKEMASMGKSLETVFHTHIEKGSGENLGLRVVWEIAFSSQAPSLSEAGYSFRGSFERSFSQLVDYRRKEDGAIFRPLSDQYYGGTVLSFNGEGLLKNELFVSCSPEVLSLPISRRLDRRVDGADIDPDKTFSCRDQENSYEVTAMGEAPSLRDPRRKAVSFFSWGMNPDGPEIYLSLYRIKSLRWSHKGKRYLITRKANAGDPGLWGDPIWSRPTDTVWMDPRTGVLTPLDPKGFQYDLVELKP